MINSSIREVKQMNIKEIFNSDNKTLADWCFNEFHQPIEADIESSDGLRCISYQMVKLANQYSYLASVMSYIKVFLRRAREDGNKDVVNLLVDKKDIIENALKTVSQKHAVLSRQITIKSDIMKKLNMGSQR